MAADTLSAAGAQVDLFDAMPTVGRKFLLAGRGGLNLTHSEPHETFLTRFAERQAALAPMLAAFDATALRQWALELGIDTFVGTSGRVFPTDLKAAPLLRAWLHRVRAQGVHFHMRHRWVGVDGADASTSARTWHFETPGGPQTWTGSAVLLALGGGSWSRLGSDGAWVPLLGPQGVGIAPLKPANCGFDVAATGPNRSGWSDFLKTRFAGQPIKPVALSMTDAQGQAQRQQGEFVLTDTGVEGSLIYAFSARIRDLIERDGQARIELDLLPNHSPAQALAEVTRPRGPRSLSTHLKSRLGITGLKAALLHEVLSADQLNDGQALAQALKALPLSLVRPRPMDEAISTAGGVTFEALDANLMAHVMPGMFCAGEMLDWEAPTGGYLLTATMASGRWAAHGLLDWLRTSRS